VEHTLNFDVQRLIAEVAARHRLLLKPDDAAFAIVTMNRLVLEQSFETIHARVLEELASFEAVSLKVEKRAQSVLAAQVRESAAAIRGEIQRDIDHASLQASKILQQIATTYHQPLSRQRFTVAVLAAAVLLLCGVWLGRVSALWWPL
jgi:hypothetical protein